MLMFCLLEDETSNVCNSLKIIFFTEWFLLIAQCYT